MSEPELFAPTKGYPKATYISSKSRRKKSKAREIATKPMLVGARL